MWGGTRHRTAFARMLHCMTVAAELRFDDVSIAETVKIPWF
ncbi:hypothetical protein GLA29479_3569 [Lysobacter antibioticus]|nr:hypothetical protein GLA29479_3569 [Lysobacter antibioticus]